MHNVHTFLLVPTLNAFFSPVIVIVTKRLVYLMNLPFNSGIGRWEEKTPDQQRSQLMMGQQKGCVLW